MPEDQEKESKTKVEAETKDRPVIKVEEIKETKEKPAEEPKPDVKSNTKSLILSFLIGFILGGVLVGGVFYWKNSVAKDSKQEVSTKPTSVVTPTPIPEPTSSQEEIDLSKYSVRVLNGSGVTGAAASVRDLLKGQGFEEIEIGNATSSGFTDTEVQLKKDVPDEVFEQIKKSLDDYSVIKDGLLSEDNSYDIIITIGKRE